VGDAGVEGSRRWDVLWVYYEAEELRVVHHRTTIPSEEVRALVVALLAAGRIPPLQATLLAIQRPGAQPLLQRFWATVCQHNEIVYLILLINDRCLVLAPDDRCDRAWGERERNPGPVPRDHGRDPFELLGSGSTTAMSRAMLLTGQPLLMMSAVQPRWIEHGSSLTLFLNDRGLLFPLWR
jgi:hypothetical protein